MRRAVRLRHAQRALPAATARERANARRPCPARASAPPTPARRPPCRPARLARQRGRPSATLTAPGPAVPRDARRAAAKAQPLRCFCRRSCCGESAPPPRLARAPTPERRRPTTRRSARACAPLARAGLACRAASPSPRGGDAERARAPAAAAAAARCCAFLRAGTAEERRAMTSLSLPRSAGVTTAPRLPTARRQWS